MNETWRTTYYWYRFFTRTADSPVGRFRTALPPDSREPVRIGFFSCHKYSSGYYAARRGLAAEPDLDLIVSLGDYVYWSADADGPQQRRDRTGRDQDGNVQTLPEYRDKYALYRADPDLQAVHAAAGFYGVWDDNDVENNYTGDVEGTDGANRRIPFLDRRANAYRACFEWLPFRRVPRLGQGRIYRSLDLGRNAELLFLDTRRHRDDQACDDRAGVPCREAYEAGRTMVGAAQKQWLKAALGRSGATWKLLANQVMMMSLDSLPYQQINNDQWDGYAAERQELMDHVVDRNIHNVAVLTGDIHTFFAGTVTTTGRNDGRPAATEFVGGSVTSAGIPELLFGPGAEKTRGAALAEQFGTANPHIAYTDMEHRGYGVLEATRDELRVEFRAVDSVLDPRSPVFTTQRFRVASGSTEVELAG